MDIICQLCQQTTWLIPNISTTSHYLYYYCSNNHIDYYITAYYNDHNQYYDHYCKFSTSKYTITYSSLRDVTSISSFYGGSIINLRGKIIFPHKVSIDVFIENMMVMI